MINKVVNSVVITAIVVMNEGLAKMEENGVWTGHDWHIEDNDIRVTNGKVSSDDYLVNRKIVAAIPLEGYNVKNYMRSFNVWRVRRHLKKSDFENLFPLRNPIYTYEGFLQAVGMFPKFCAEATSRGMFEITCKRELATLFAHFVQETGYNSK